MRRRTLFAAAGTLTAPSISRGANAVVPRFIPQSDLAVLDPIWTAPYVIRNHAMMVFGTLYGNDSEYRISSRMVASHATHDDGRTWSLTLREDLYWHDGQPVLARDCVASIRRWAARGGFGQTLLAVTHELSAPDDTTIRFRLNRPFPPLPAALGKPSSNICAMTPERLAVTDPFHPITEMLGSGPFRLKPDQHIAGAKVVM